MPSSGPGPEAHYPTATRVALLAAARLGMEAEVLDPEFGYLFEVRSEGRRRVFLGGRSPLNDAVAARLAEDKHYTTLLLERAGLRVPPTVRCLSLRDPNLTAYRDKAGMEPGAALAAEVGYPVVVKPNRLSHGRGVRLVSDRRELGGAVRAAWELDGIALVQACVEGRDLRLDFLNGELLAGYERRSLEVRGDGKSTLEALLRAQDPRMRDPEQCRRLLASPALTELLSKRGWGATTVIPEGGTVSLAGPIRNLNTGSTPRVLDRIAPAVRDACLAAGAAIGLVHFGVDLKVDSLKPASPSEVTIIEVNASPLLSQLYLSGHTELAVEAQVKVLSAVFA